MEWTKERILHYLTLCNHAPVGPWSYDRKSCKILSPGLPNPHVAGLAMSEPMATFLVMARMVLPNALFEIQRLQDELKQKDKKIKELIAMDAFNKGQIYGLNFLLGKDKGVPGDENK